MSRPRIFDLLIVICRRAAPRAVRKAKGRFEKYAADKIASG